MKERKTSELLVILLNVIGTVCLIYYAIPYLTHDTTVRYPEAMIPFEEWDRAGWILQFGCIPLLIANVWAMRSVSVKGRYTKFLFLAPGMICLILVISYWVTSLLK